jgi:nitrogen fixation NifU-like protein
VLFYRQKILDHYKNPYNRGKFSNPDCHSRLDNPLCGDIIDIYLKISNNKIKDIKFKAEGCAISIAAMSMLSERVKGRKIKEVLSLKKEDILEMLGIPLSATRLKCGILGLTALRQCLEHFNGRTLSVP